MDKALEYTQLHSRGKRRARVSIGVLKPYLIVCKLQASRVPRSLRDSDWGLTFRSGFWISGKMTQKGLMTSRNLTLTEKTKEELGLGEPFALPG